MSDPDFSNKAMSISSHVMIAAIVFFFAVLLFVFLLNLYARLRWGPPSRPTTRSVLIFAPSHHDNPRRGLDPSLLHSLPVHVYNPNGTSKPGLECAVCLSELAAGEKVRFLPKCQHGFHVECIDMWFYSHSTCPLCRSGVDGDKEDVRGVPTNVLFWGSSGVETSSSSSAASEGLGSGPSSSGSGVCSGGELKIEIPRRAVEGIASPATGTPTPTPTPSRLRSLRRFLSREKRPSGSPSGSGCDVEQGLTPAATPTGS